MRTYNIKNAFLHKCNITWESGTIGYCFSYTKDQCYSCLKHKLIGKSVTSWRLFVFCLFVWYFFFFLVFWMCCKHKHYHIRLFRISLAMSSEWPQSCICDGHWWHRRMWKELPYDHDDTSNAPRLTVNNDPGYTNNIEIFYFTLKKLTFWHIELCFQID